MRLLIVAAVFTGLVTGPALAIPPTEAPAPSVLFAQLDDSDLKTEETLEDLQEIEFDKDSWSMGSAIGLSMLPGGGFGLIYAEKRAQAIIPILLSAVGYGVGAAYLLGAFDESSTQVCLHDTAGVVKDAECRLADDPVKKSLIDGRFLPDICSRYGGRNPVTSGDIPVQCKAYFQTRDQYGPVTRGEDFDGKNTGIVIIGATYIATSLLGAIWAATAVSDHNEQLRKDIESTASVPKPVINFDGTNGYVGLTVNF